MRARIMLGLVTALVALVLAVMIGRQIPALIGGAGTDGSPPTTVQDDDTAPDDDTAQDDDTVEGAAPTTQAPDSATPGPPTPGYDTSAQPAPAGTAEPTSVRWIAPAGQGNGGSQDDPAALSSLPDLVAELPAGAEVRILADRGPYQVDETVQLHVGGTATRPLQIRGWPAGDPAPVLQGHRASPYRPDGEPGGEVFRLAAGADHVTFTHLSLRDVGTVFRIAGDIQGLRIADIGATNVRHFLNTTATDDDSTASIVGLVVHDVTVAGFSKSVLRLRYDTNDVVVSDVVGDSQRQDGDNFAVGIHLSGTVHDVLLRRVTMDNTHDSLHDYWNGDGFAIEREVTDVHFQQTSANGHTDAGYDIKGTGIVLEDVRATDNKRNYRFWGSDIHLRDCVGADPNRRGGVGTQAQVHLAEGAEVLIEGCAFSDASEETIVFDVDGPPATAEVRASTVRRDPGSTLESVVEGSTLSLSPDVHDRIDAEVAS